MKILRFLDNKGKNVEEMKRQRNKANKKKLIKPKQQGLCKLCHIIEHTLERWLTNTTMPVFSAIVMFVFHCMDLAKICSLEVQRMCACHLMLLCFEPYTHLYSCTIVPSAVGIIYIHMCDCIRTHTLAKMAK